MSRKMKIIFTVSVMLNLLLLGITGGMMARSWDRHQRWHDMTSEFSPAVQNTIAHSLQEFRRDMKDTFAEMKNARSDMRDAMKAREFNETAFKAASKRMEAAHKKIKARKDEMLQELAKELSPADRAKLSSRLMHPYGKKGHYKKGEECGEKEG